MSGTAIDNKHTCKGYIVQHLVIPQAGQGEGSVFSPTFSLASPGVALGGSRPPCCYPSRDALTGPNWS